MENIRYFEGAQGVQGMFVEVCETKFDFVSFHQLAHPEHEYHAGRIDELNAGHIEFDGFAVLHAVAQRGFEFGLRASGQLAAKPRQ